MKRGVARHTYCGVHCNPAIYWGMAREMPRPKEGMKVLQVNVAEAAYNDLEIIAFLSRSTPSEIVRVKLDELIRENREDVDKVKRMASR